MKKIYSYLLFFLCVFQQFSYISFASLNNNTDLEVEKKKDYRSFARSNNNTDLEVEKKNESSHTCVPEYSSVLLVGIVDFLTLGMRATAKSQIRLKYLNFDSSLRIECPPDKFIKCDKWDPESGKCSDLSMDLLLKRGDKYEKTSMKIVENVSHSEQISSNLFGLIPIPTSIYLSLTQDYVCVQGNFLLLSPYVGCTFLEEPFKQSIYHEEMHDTPSTYSTSNKNVQHIKDAVGNCVRDAQKNSSSEVNSPIFSTIYLCTSRVLDTIRKNSLTSVRSSLINFVKYSLILYVIFVGFNLILTQEINKTLFITHIVKIVFVTYFSIGISISDNTVENGFDKYVLPFVTNAGSEISSFLSGIGNKCSTILNETYKQGYEALSFWNYVDCYFAVLVPNILLIVLVTIYSLTFNFFLVLLPLQYIIAVILMFTFVIETFVRSLVVISILAIVSPIFITMYLFNFTKGYFEKFIKINLSMILQPFIASLYMFICILLLENVIDGIVHLVEQFNLDWNIITSIEDFIKLIPYLPDFIRSILISSVVCYILLGLRGNISQFIATITEGPTLVNFRQMNFKPNNRRKAYNRGTPKTNDFSQKEFKDVITKKTDKNFDVIDSRNNTRTNDFVDKKSVSNDDKNSVSNDNKISASNDDKNSVSKDSI